MAICGNFFFSLALLMVTLMVLMSLADGLGVFWLHNCGPYCRMPKSHIKGN